MPTRWTRLFATGLVGAALAAPLSASAGPLDIVNNLQGGTTAVLWQPTTVRVNSPRELLLTLYNAQFTGLVIIPRDVQWNLTGYRQSSRCARGVQLIGERGALGSRPLLYTTSPTIDDEGYNFFEVVGNNVRVEGIHFRGPANGNRSSSQPLVSGIKIGQTAGGADRRTRAALGSSSPTTSSRSGPRAACRWRATCAPSARSARR